MVCYREALADDPSQDTAKTRLEHLRKILERKVGAKLNAVFVPADSWLNALETLLLFHTHISKFMSLCDLDVFCGGCRRFFNSLCVWMFSWSFVSVSTPPTNPSPCVTSLPLPSPCGLAPGSLGRLPVMMLALRRLRRWRERGRRQWRRPD